jgi:superfamily I DNA/RNA helicase
VCGAEPPPECIAYDEEGLGPLARKSRKGRVDLAAGAGLEDLDLQRHGARGPLRRSSCRQLDCGTRKSRPDALQERIETVGDDADLQEVYDTERHLLYVACTRARDHLLITSVEPASEFLDDLRM